MKLHLKRRDRYNWGEQITIVCLRIKSGAVTYSSMPSVFGLMSEMLCQRFENLERLDVRLGRCDGLFKQYR